jgi:hypothetical protein
MKELNIKNLRPLRDLCADGSCPLAYKTASIHAGKGDLPAVKIRNLWHSSEDLLRTYFYKGANKAARRVLI